MRGPWSRQDVRTFLRRGLATGDVTVPGDQLRPRPRVSSEDRRTALVLWSTSGDDLLRSAHGRIHRRLPPVRGARLPDGGPGEGSGGAGAPGALLHRPQV